MISENFIKKILYFFSCIDRFWSDEVKQRIRSTYFYFGASVGLTAATAVAIARTPALMNIAMKSSMTVSILKNFSKGDLLCIKIK